MPPLGCLLAAILMAASPAAPGQERPAPAEVPRRGLDPVALGRPAIRTFGEAEGLGRPTVHSLAFDGLGRVWAGTNVGVMGYDGRRWFPLALPSWVRSTLIRTLVMDADGSCWLGTQDAGLVGWQGGRWVQHTLGSGLPARRVNHLLKVQGASGHSELWVATTGGLAHLSEGTWTTEGAGEGLPDPWVWRLMESRDPFGVRTLWAATRRGLARREGARWVAVPLPPGDPAEQVNELLMVDRAAGGQDLWIGLWGGGLARRREGTWTRFGPREGVPSRFPTSLAATPRPGADPLIWAGFMDTGLAAFDGQGWRTLDESRGLPAAGVYALAGSGSARRPALWVGMRGAGVARLEPERGWVRFLAADGLPAEAVNTLAEVPGPSGPEYWAGTTRGLARFTPSGWKPEGPAGMINTLQSGPSPAGDLTLWAGTLTGLYRRDPSGWVAVRPRPGSPPMSVYRILTSAGAGGASRLWVIGATALQELDQGTWRFHGPENGLPLEASSLVSIPRLGGDRILLGSRGQGVSELVAGRWQPLKEGGPLANATVNSLAWTRRPDGGFRLWAGTAGGGLGWLDLDLPGSRWEFLTSVSTPALPSDMVLRIEAHPSGDLYGFTAKGVFRLASGPRDFAVTTYTTGDGLPSTACSLGGSMIDSRGRVWAGTAAGLAILDPAREQGEPAPLSPVLTGIAVNGAPCGDLGTRPLAHRENQIRFSFLLPTFHREEDVAFRTQLVGAEAAPTPWSADAHRDYPALEAGSYGFRLWARDAAGQVTGPVSVAFSIRPAPWRSLWAFLGYAGLLGLATGSLFRARTRRFRARAAELERAVETRTHELALSHARLQEAQDRISELMASSSHALEDLSAWAKSMAVEIARTLGLREVAVYERRTGPATLAQATLSPLHAGLALPDDLMPLLEDLPADPEAWVAARGNLLLGIQGLTGEVRGALVLPGVTEAELPGPARQLLAGFARQLGSALEMQEVRRQLAEAESRRTADREELHARGVATLQLCPVCGRCFDHTVKACPVDAAAPQPQGLLPYRIRDRYRFESLLGSGGMGSVYAARDEELDRRVAIKLLNPDLFNHVGARLRFDREARALARINHPGVIQLFDRGELEDGTCFLVMELLAGQDLAEQLRLQGPGSPAQVAQLLRQVGAALDAAHAAGVIHRDIKPQNLVLSPAPDGFAAKLLDFGVAKPSGADAGLTRAGTVVGTPSYMAPEQVQGSDAGPRTDLYALAAVAFEALTGQRLMPTGDAGSVMMRVLQEASPAPSSLLPDLPPGVDRAFAEALAKRPEDRPAAAGVWAETLAGLLEPLPDGGRGWTGFESSRNPAPLGDLPTRVEARTSPAGKAPVR
ncbi:MAG: protein kinase [Holophagaceae bacterium]|nr:protein kinase [Holophagaceae bacterium]